MKLSNTIRFIYAVSVFAIIFVFTPATVFGQVLDLDIKRKERKKIQIAVVPFSFVGEDRENLGLKTAKTISFDLKFTGYFSPNENFDHLVAADEADIKRRRIDFKEWNTLAPSGFLVKGKFSPTRGAKLTLSVKVYNVRSQKVTYSRRYTGSIKQSRQMAHLFADDLLKRVRGDEGVAQSRIGFVSRLKGRKELHLTDYDGKNTRRITSDRSLVLFPHLNPASNKVLFTTYKYRNPDLYMLDLSTGSRAPISRKLGLNTTGEFSPDGSKVVFSLSYRGNSEIYTSNIDGSGLRKLTRSIAIETSPTWSPDGKYIAYTSDRPGSPQIYVMKSDGSDQQRLTYKGGYNDGATWSPKGDFIAYASLLNKRFNIAIIDARRADKVIRREVIQLTAGQGNNESPSFSPNGRHIAFMSSRAGGKQIFIMNATGDNQTQITSLRGGGYSPTWGKPVSDLSF